MKVEVFVCGHGAGTELVLELLSYKHVCVVNDSSCAQHEILAAAKHVENYIGLTFLFR